MKKTIPFWIILLFALTALWGCTPDVRDISSPSETAPGVISGRLCAADQPSSEIILYFESTTGDYLQSLTVDQGVKQYSVEIKPGTYTVFAWPSDSLLQGGGYSAAVPCGLEPECNDHSLLPVEVEAGQETGQVDICDWEAGYGAVPLPPGKVETLILNYLQQEHPDFSADSPLSLQELSMQGETIRQVQSRIYQITKGPFQDHSFLISGDLIVIPLGSADGGQGLTSLALSDLDMDEQSELYFTYSFGSGTHQSRLGMYAPAYHKHAVYEANTAYRGDLMLFSEQPHQVGVRVVEADQDTKTITYITTLGYLSISTEDSQPVLQLDLADDLPPEIQEAILRP